MNAQRMASDEYALRFDVDYPEELNRLTTAFRIILVIPIAIVLSAVSAGGYATPGEGFVPYLVATIAAVGGGLFIPTVLMIVFRLKYPRWWFDWNLELARFGQRVGAYSVLLRDEYPSTDEQQAVHLDIDYPNVEQDLNRWLPLVKWFLAIPHYIVLFVLAIIAFFVVVFAWFAILFTGRYPRGFFDFIVGVSRWSLRVQAYAFLLVTDRYPPFSMQ